MNRYRIIKNIGDGTYGSVLQAVNKKTNAVVAIKKMKKKFYSWEECVKLREVQSLKKLNHPNIVKLKEVIRENDELHFVFEFLEKNVYEMTKERKKFLPEKSIRKYMFQMISALAYMHKNGFFHRDMKPENLLLGADDNCKLADFGLAREIRSKPPYTDYVSTRWYRAPEVLLRSAIYNSPLDMWAVGCIMAELYTFRPLFPGASESDQIYRICSVLGPPTRQTWEDGVKLAHQMGYKFPSFTRTKFEQLIPTASRAGLQLLTDLLAYDPAKRPSASDALRYPYFKDLSLEALNAEGCMMEQAPTSAPAAIPRPVPKDSSQSYSNFPASSGGSKPKNSNHTSFPSISREKNNTRPDSENSNRPDTAENGSSLFGVKGGFALKQKGKSKPKQRGNALRAAGSRQMGGASGASGGPRYGT